MRATPSRFSSFVMVDPNVEGRPNLTSRPAAGDQSVLEQRYPHAVRTLTLLWGYPELNQYFDKVSSGVEPGLGFDAAAMAELMLLAAVHQRVCPHRPAPAVDSIAAGRWSAPWRPARPRG